MPMTKAASNSEHRVPQSGVAAAAVTAVKPETPSQNPSELGYEATVPRALVHRRSVAEVFVTDSRQTAPDAFEVAAQLPRGHLMAENPGVHEPLLIIESMRQAGVLIAHRHMDVPLDTAFIMGTIGFQVDSLEGMRVRSEEPSRLLIHAKADTQVNRRGRILGFDFTGSVDIDGSHVLTAHGSLNFLSKRSYRVLRARGRSILNPRTAVLPRLVPVAPAEVGRHNPRNVVITPPVLSAGLRASASIVAHFDHPHLFDHPLDHIPGNLVIEAARQLAVSGLSRSYGIDPTALLPVTIAAEFAEFVESDSIAQLDARLGELTRDERSGAVVSEVTVDVRQNGAVAGTVRLEVAQWI